MASANFLSLGFCFLLLVRGNLGQLDLAQRRIWQQLQEQQQHLLAARPPCNIERISAREPAIRIPSEAGLTEVWDSNNPESECAVVKFERITVQPNGLVMPHYSNAAKAYFVVQGRAVHGTVIPGCAETFESPVTVRGQGRRQRQTFIDRHQRLVRVRQGDFVAEAAGYTHWIFNDGDVPFVLVSLADLANGANQLDLQYRNFFLAGNSQQQQQQQGQQGQQGQREQQGQQGQQGEGGRRWSVGQSKNIFNGIDDNLLARILRISVELARKLNGQEDNQRGGIVLAEGLQLSLPEFDQEELRERQQQQQQQQQQGQQQGQSQSGGGGNRRWRPNGLEETECSVRIRENIAHPARADLYNPRAGRLSTINSQTLPILDVLGLSGEHGNLYSNAIYGPYWTINAHTVLYVIRGSARIQVVGATGNQVFNDEVNEGQLIIIPQNFVVIKKAGNQGFEYIAFKTNDNAMTSSLAGRLSTLRAIPNIILRYIYRISEEQADELKYGRQEATLFSGSDESQGRVAVA